MLAARQESEEEQGFRFVTRSIIDGKPVNLEELAKWRYSFEEE
jgi:hypothetical protein